MKKQTLNEEIFRIKGLMGKIMNEAFDDFDTQIQPEERPESDGMNISDMNSDEHEFKVGDTVSDPVALGEGPNQDGKILAVYPNLESAKGTSAYDKMVEWITTIPQMKAVTDVNDTFYLIKWRKEPTNLWSKSEIKNIIIAPDNRDYDDYEDEDGEGEDMCSCCNGIGEGPDERRCSCCGGSGEGKRSKYGGRDDFDGYDDNGGYEYPDGYDGR